MRRRRALARLALAVFAGHLLLLTPAGPVLALDARTAHAAEAAAPEAAPLHATAVIPQPEDAMPCETPGTCPFGLMLCGPGGVCLAVTALPSAPAALAASSNRLERATDPAPSFHTYQPSTGTPPPRA